MKTSNEYMKQYFASQFRKRWNELGYKGNKEFEDKFSEFRDLLREEKGEGEKYIHKNTVGNWKKGSHMPDDESLQVICKVMGVNEEYFFPQTNADKYRCDEQYMKDEVGKALLTHAEKLDLNLEFIHAIRQLVDFDESFPLWSQIRPAKNDLDVFFDYEDGEDIKVTYERANNFAESAPMNDNQDIQVMRDGKRVTMHLNDFEFLKDVQTQVEDYIKYLFYKRSLEMETEVKEINNLAGSRERITAKDLNRIDHYGKYKDKTPSK